MLKAFKYIYFVGIGGIGMSALARWFKLNNFWVGGYDKTPTSLTEQLIEEGIEIHFEDNLNYIPDFIKDNPQETLVIFTPAIPQNHLELNFFQENQFQIKKRAEVLGLLTKNHFTIAVAGTHGKTTTSSMIAHILKQANVPCTAFLGGIVKNYNSNLLLSQEIPEKTIIVVEADEYDKSFLQLSPDITIVTSTDADHLDIYRDANHVKTTFQQFIELNKNSGAVFIHKNTHLQAKVQQFQYTGEAKEEINSDFFADFVNIANGHFYFDFVGKNITIDNIKMNVVGYHNIENAVVAMAVCLFLNIDPHLVKRGIETFEGAKRRFDFLKRDEKNVIIDDYAHHPTELKALLSSSKALYPHKKITIVFQPHLFSRTRDFMNEFAKALSMADEVILLPIYPAREQPIQGITSESLLKKITTKEKKLLSKENILLEINKKPREVLIFAGAGDIDKLALQSIEKSL
jgi:UDP-N-acetylmuramate--alanine ligase